MACSSNDMVYSWLSMLLVAAASCVIFTLSVALLSRRSRDIRLPPGPPALPILGHIHKLGPHPHKSLQKLSSTYGPLMFLRFGSRPLIVASSPEMAREILQKQDQNFSWRFEISVHKVLHSCSTIVFSQPGTYWRSIRQICAVELFAPMRLRMFQPIITEEVRSMLRSIDADGHHRICIRPKLYAASSNIISRMSLGKKLEDIGEKSSVNDSSYLTNLLVEVIHLVGVFNISDFVPWLAWLDLQGCEHKSKKLSVKLQKVWKNILDERRHYRKSRPSGQKDSDFLDTLLSASETKDLQITDENIRAILFDIFAGGIDTSAITVEWALAELISHPSKMKRVQDEIDQLVRASRLVQLEDIQCLPYFEAVIKETMRLHPVTPFLVPHMAKHDCRIGEFDIPANTQAYINVWAMGRDETIWKNPLDFSPERFLDSDMDIRGHHFELLPFGSGRRACPGMLLGINNVNMMLASLVQGFDFVADQKIDKAEKFGIVMSLESPLAVKASRRISSHLLE
ncbi:hypothetical protein KP509_01G035300 [Ceratopteris richardii]|uniref:Cytochrome P450 n=1 Tax=Ceratopteris richardii TaxID=49495 RepID=A0A8T2VC49_CERRI|nr:hypothetical protein KP509_01G035300 [Ceratopteris richardii]